MKISIDNYERELLIDTLEYRIYNDERLIRDADEGRSHILIGENRR